MEIMEVWVGSGLPAENKESVTIKSNGYVTISNLANHVCRLLIGNIYNKSHFDKKLFCNGIIPLTPEKKDTETFSSVKTSTTAVLSHDIRTSRQSSPASAATPAPASASLGRSSPGRFDRPCQALQGETSLSEIVPQVYSVISPLSSVLNMIS